MHVVLPVICFIFLIYLFFGRANRLFTLGGYRLISFFVCCLYYSTVDLFTVIGIPFGLHQIIFIVLMIVVTGLFYEMYECTANCLTVFCLFLYLMLDWHSFWFTSRRLLF